MHLPLDTTAVQSQSKRSSYGTNHDGWKTHLRLSNTAIASSKVVRHPVGEITTEENAKEASNNGREEAKTRLPWIEPVSSVECWSNVRGNSHDESNSHRHDQRCPEDGRQNQESHGANGHLPQRFMGMLAVV